MSANDSKLDLSRRCLYFILLHLTIPHSDSSALTLNTVSPFHEGVSGTPFAPIQSLLTQPVRRSEFPTRFSGLGKSYASLPTSWCPWLALRFNNSPRCPLGLGFFYLDLAGFATHVRVVIPHYHSSEGWVGLIRSWTVA